jgi:hypothetical protein
MIPVSELSTLSGLEQLRAIFEGKTDGGYPMTNLAVHTRLSHPGGYDHD